MGFDLTVLKNTNVTSVVNRLSSCIDNWKLVTNNQFVLRIVKEGYRIQFQCPATANDTPIIYPMIKELEDHTRQEVRNLIEKGAIKAVEPDVTQVTSGIFSRFKKNHTVENPKIRVILNLKKLNTCVRKIRFRMETLAGIRQFLRPGWYLASLDCTDAYFTIGVHPDHKRFLRFFWDGQCWEYQCLCFGLSSCPRIFTKIMKVAVCFLRTHFKIHVTVYLDDLLLMAPTMEECLRAINVTFLVLSVLGFGISVEKSTLTPTVYIRPFVFGFTFTKLFPSVHFFFFPARTGTPWRYNQHIKVDFLASPEEMRQDHKAGQEISSQGGLHVHGIRVPSRNIRGNNSGSLLCTFTLEGTAARSNRSQASRASSKAVYPVRSKANGRSPMVGASFAQPQQLSNNRSTSDRRPFFRRFKNGVRLADVCGRPEKCDRTATANFSRQYQAHRDQTGPYSAKRNFVHAIQVHAPRTKAAYCGSGDDGIDRNSWCHHTTRLCCQLECRQPVGTMVRPETGRNKVRHTEPARAEVLGHCAGTQASDPLQLCPNGRKSGGHRVEEVSRQMGFPTGQRPVHRDVSESRILGEQRLVCQSELPPGSEVCNKTSDSGCRSDGRAVRQVVGQRLFVPTGAADRQMPTENSSRQMPRAARVPGVGHEHVLDARPEVDGAETVRSPACSRVSQGPGDGTTADSQIEPIEGLSARRQKLLDQGFNPRTVDLLESDIRSKAQYNMKWTRFVKYCQKLKFDPFTCPVAVICNFLLTLGGKFRTVSSWRSVLSKYHDPIDGMAVGKHPLVLRLIKGVFLANPPIPKYTSTWPLEKLLTYLSSLHPIEDLDLATLSKKTATLVRLSTNSRSSTLCLLANKPVYEDTKIVFPLLALEKQGRPIHIRGWVSCAVTHNPKLDVSLHVKAYLEKTASLRSGSSLFMALSKPHNPIRTATTFAKWTLTLMSAAGIDTNKFQSHSTRSAVAANLKSKSLSLDQILKRTDWTSITTFRTFYDKQVAGEVQTTTTARTSDPTMERDDYISVDPLINFET